MPIRRRWRLWSLMALLLLMALVPLGAGRLGLIEVDDMAERRRMELEVQANLERAAAEAPRIRKDQAAREIAAKAAELRSLEADLREMERVVAERKAVVTRLRDRLAERAMEADVSEIPEIVSEAERLGREEAYLAFSVREWRRRNGVPVP